MSADIAEQPVNEFSIIRENMEVIFQKTVKFIVSTRDRLILKFPESKNDINNEFGNLVLDIGKMTLEQSNACLTDMNETVEEITSLLQDLERLFEKSNRCSSGVIV